MVEQLTFNELVVGSSPTEFNTKLAKKVQKDRAEQTGVKKKKWVVQYEKVRIVHQD